MNLNLLLMAAAFSSYAEEMKTEEAIKAEKTPTENKQSLKVQQEEHNRYVFDENNPQLTNFLLTHFLRSCKKEDVLNYVNVQWEKAESDTELYHAQQTLYKTKNYIHVISTFEAKNSPGKYATTNLERDLGLNLLPNGPHDPQLYSHINNGSIKDNCSKCSFIVFTGPVDREHQATVYCDTYIKLNDSDEEKIAEEIAQKVATEKEQAKEKDAQPLSVPFILKLKD